MTATTADVRRMHAIYKRLRAADVKVVLVPGWDERGRPQSFQPLAVVDHHDASTRKAGEWGALGIITHGRAGIPAPLSQFQGARCLDGIPKVAIVAAGRANHAGFGGPWRGIPRDSGNRYAYGVEWANDGRGEPYTDAAVYAKNHLFAAVLEVVTT